MVRSAQREKWMRILESGKAAPSDKNWSLEKEAATAKLKVELVSIEEHVLG